MAQKGNDFITAGELAKIAGTTKRTIHFYGEKGILKPKSVRQNRYRYYQESQVLDYQMILLLTTLGVPLGEIKRYLRKNGNLNQLFNSKKALIKKEVNRLQFNLQNLEKFLDNLKANGTLVNPQIKTLKPFGVYYIEKTGAYAQIESFCLELRGMLTQNDRDLTTLSIFHNSTYQPKASRIWIGVLAKSGMKIKKEFADQVKYVKFAPGKVIAYAHCGSGSLLSLFWKELEEYCRLHQIKVRKEMPDFEIYRRPNADETKQLFEIYLPIE